MLIRAIQRLFIHIVLVDFSLKIWGITFFLKHVPNVCSLLVRMTIVILKYKVSPEFRLALHMINNIVNLQRVQYVSDTMENLYGHTLCVNM